MKESNLYLKGRNGAVWINDDVCDTASEFEAKVEWEYEEVPCGMSYTQVLTGYKVSGSLKLRKTNSRVLNLVVNDYMQGIIPDIKIIGKVFNPVTKETERVAYLSVTFDSSDLTKFASSGEIIEEEVPWKAEKFEILQSIK